MCKQYVSHVSLALRRSELMKIFQTHWTEEYWKGMKFSYGGIEIVQIQFLVSQERRWEKI